MSKKPTGAAAGNSEAIRIYERMEEERKQKVQAKAEANKPKKVPRSSLWMRSSTRRANACPAVTTRAVVR
jgi:hypothetical protein